MCALIRRVLKTIEDKVDLDTIFIRFAKRLTQCYLGGNSNNELNHKNEHKTYGIVFVYNSCKEYVIFAGVILFTLIL